MEDLLKPSEREGLHYLSDRPPPADPAELVARKALWVLGSPVQTNCGVVAELAWDNDRARAAFF